MVKLDTNVKFSVSSIVTRLSYNHNLSRFEASAMLDIEEGRLWERADAKSNEPSTPRCYVEAHNVLDRYYNMKKYVLK
jgi:hypothetical protein